MIQSQHFKKKWDHAPNKYHLSSINIIEFYIKDSDT